MAFFSNLKPIPRFIVIGSLVGLAVYGANFGLKKFGSPAATGTAAPAPAVAFTADTVKALGTTANPLKVSIVSFHGYAPALVANGNSLTTQAGSIYANAGLNVNFVVNDDVPTLTTLFEGGTAQCAWRTSDFWAQEQPNLRNAKHDAKAVVVVDNTQGGDAIIAKDGSIKSVEDLAGHTVALLQYTPSHGLLIDAINNSSLSAKKKASIKMVFINADEGTGGVRAAFESGKVDAAVLWDPDLALAIKNGGGHVVYSTKQATNLIFDVMVCDSRVLATAEGKDAVQKFVSGWMAGVTAARANKDGAVTALTSTEKMFTLLGKQEGPAFIKGLFENVVWTDLADNARILGLTPGGTNHYERVYGQFDQIYRGAGALANPASPVIPAQDSFDYSFIKNLLANNGAAVTAAQAPQTTFTTAGLQTAATKTTTLTKPVLVKFASGSYELTQAAKRVIDTEMVPFIENNGSAYFEISGNTDSIGTALANRQLSSLRAQTVVEYLVKQWDMSKSRFKVVGNGSDKPLCDETNPDGVTIDECRATNRATRVGLFSR
jgi:outer membrane protein OmpA-like peptidoglycan-associated protein/ABC-type amino acid transport substrate-binding protein